VTPRPGVPGDANPATAPSELRERRAGEQREQGEVQWSFDPWSERPVAAGVAALAVLGMWLILAACRLPWLLALGLGVFVTSPLAPAILPAACRIEPAGAARRGVLGWVRRSWVDVRRIDDVPVGVFLSPYASRHWLDATRGLALPMPGPRRAELAALVRERWGARAR
jgi:hypothetical protein